MTSGGQGAAVSPKRFSGNSKTGERNEPYVRDDGTTVRDHRKNAPEPNFERRATLPAAISKVKPKTLAAVRMALRPQMQTCIKEHAGEATSGAKAQAVLTVSITDGLLRVDELAFQSEGLAPESDAALGACARAAMLGHEQTIEGSVDVAKHVMTFPYNL